MTTAIATQPFTVSAFLFGQGQDPEQALAQASTSTASSAP
jgi:hypothetical protein